MLCPDALWPVLSAPSCCECSVLKAHSCALLSADGSSLSWRFLEGHRLLCPPSGSAHGRRLTDTGMQELISLGDSFVVCSQPRTPGRSVSAWHQLKPCLCLASPAPLTFLQVSLESPLSINEVHRNTCLRLCSGDQTYDTH